MPLQTEETKSLGEIPTIYKYVALCQQAKREVLGAQAFVKRA
ncbi:MAG: hypothetical protein PUP91_11470 [Rhizonema sp. PD37]|nr:hypothetical protein [Rhizonema sp. PD37]